MQTIRFMDETHSALRDIEQSVALIRRCNDSIATSMVNDALRKLKLSIRLIRHCDRMLRDDRGFRSKPGAKKPTVWEIQELIGSPHTKPDGKPNPGYDPRYEGSFGPNGEYILKERVSKKVINTITKQEMDKRFNEFLSSRNTARVSRGSAGYAGSGAVNGSSVVLGSFASPEMYEDPNKNPGVLAKVLRAAKMIGEISLTIGALNFLATGDKLAEAGGQIGRFAKFIAEKASQIKEKITGRK